MKTAYCYSRLSTTRQLEGSGYARQSKRPEQLCKDNGWILSDRTFQDYGISAWKGKNRLQGDLSKFIELVKSKKLGDEPVLILEAFDRFSRQDIDESEPAILDLLKAGCDIHVIFSGKTFTYEATKDLVSRIEILVCLKSAHDYSQNLSKRIKIQRVIKYEKMKNGEILPHQNAPKYYTFNKDSKQYDQNPELVPIVMDVVNRYLKGETLYKISMRLNDSNTRQLRYNNRKVNWSIESTRCILTNPSLYGHFQGIDNYFCNPLITKATFDKLQLMIHKNKGRRGLTSSDFINIFKGLIYCSNPECRKSFNVGCGKIDSKTKKPKKEVYRYFRCSSSSNAGKCNNKHNVELHSFEVGFFENILGGNIGIGNLMKKEEKDNSINERIESVKLQISKLNKSITNLYDLVEAGDGEAKNRIVLRKAEKDKLEAELKGLESSIVDVTDYNNGVNEIKKIMDWATEWEAKTIPLLKPIIRADGTVVNDLRKRFRDKIIADTKEAISVKNLLKSDKVRTELVKVLPTVISKLVCDSKNKTVAAYDIGGNLMGSYKITPLK